jgi:hypothetical protein
VRLAAPTAATATRRTGDASARWASEVGALGGTHGGVPCAWRITMQPRMRGRAWPCVAVRGPPLAPLVRAGPTCQDPQMPACQASATDMPFWGTFQPKSECRVMPRTHTHTHTRMHARTHISARTRTHTHALRQWRGGTPRPRVPSAPHTTLARVFPLPPSAHRLRVLQAHMHTHTHTHTHTDCECYKQSTKFFNCTAGVPTTCQIGIYQVKLDHVSAEGVGVAKV